MDLTEIRNAMKDRKVRIVAQETGLNRGTIYNLLKEDCAIPTRSTIKALEKYLGIGS